MLIRSSLAVCTDYLILNTLSDHHFLYALHRYLILVLSTLLAKDLQHSVLKVLTTLRTQSLVQTGITCTTYMEEVLAWSSENCAS